MLSSGAIEGDRARPTRANYMVILPPGLRQPHRNAGTQTDGPSCCAAVRRQLQVVQQELVDTRRRLQQALAPSGVRCSTLVLRPPHSNWSAATSATAQPQPTACKQQLAHNPVSTVKPPMVKRLVTPGPSRVQVHPELNALETAQETGTASQHLLMPGCEDGAKCLLQSVGHEQPGREAELDGDPNRDLTNSSDSSDTDGLQSEPVALPTTSANSSAGLTEHSCSQCPARLRTWLQLEQHMAAEHPGIRVFSCPQCNDIFPEVTALQDHLQLTHGIENQFPCDVCGVRYPTENTLSMHKVCHKGSAPYVCSTCGKFFKNVANLKGHESRVHQGERKHLCDTCGKRFGVLEKLRRHQMAVHLKLKPYACPLCDKHFAYKTLLKEHALIHSGARPWVCDVCGAEFRLLHHLRYHMRRHTGEKPYTCSVCERSFAHKPTLARHLLTHNTDRPYSCETCGHRCSTIKSLKAHEQEHSPS